MTLPTVTPTGATVKAINALAESIANSATWQAWCGAEDAAGAKAFIWVREAQKVTVEEVEIWQRPLAIIDVEAVKREFISVGPANVLWPAGTLGFFIEADTPAGTPDYRNLPGDAYYYFLNRLEGVRAEISARAGTAGYINAIALQHVYALRSIEAEKETEGDYWTSVTLVEWT